MFIVLFPKLAEALDERNWGASFCEPCESQYADGRLLTSIELLERLETLARPFQLCGVNLEGAYLKGIDFEKADLRYAKFSRANLSDSILVDANLCRANFFQTNLQNANLASTISYKTWFGLADLRSSNLYGATLTDAYFGRANLRGADLTSARLGGAVIVGSDLRSALFGGVFLQDAQFEPISSPDKGSLGLGDLPTRALKEVWFERGKHGGLTLLRNGYRDVGLRGLEREATYALEKNKTDYMPFPEKILRRLLFEWTSGYGLHYERPLVILLVLVFLFSFLYLIPMVGITSSGIYRVWAENRIDSNKDRGSPERLIRSGFRALAYAFYFSVLSAFHFGWRDLNVGSWIARVQPHEYGLRATGWVRSASGVQSLLSVYLIALWVLVYFGRPFG